MGWPGSIDGGEGADWVRSLLAYNFLIPEARRSALTLADRPRLPDQLSEVLTDCGALKMRVDTRVAFDSQMVPDIFHRMELA